MESSVTFILDYYLFMSEPLGKSSDEKSFMLSGFHFRMTTKILPLGENPFHFCPNLLQHLIKTADQVMPLSIGAQKKFYHLHQGE